MPQALWTSWKLPPIGRIGALLTAAFLVLSAGAASALESLPADHPKYRKVKAIYDNVARAFGDGRVPPRLIVSPLGAAGGNAVAWSDPGTEGAIGMDTDSAPLQAGYIALEEKTYDLFGSLGDNDRDSAVAFLLGHELTHYYMRHGWVGDFGNSFASLDVGRKMIKAASYEEVIKRETEADFFGGFYGHLAGYDTLGVAPKAIELIYVSYQLPSKIPNYPSRSERQAIAERAEANLRKMVPVFEAGNRLLLLERYDAAGRLFEHLAHTFPSREIFSNAGVAYASEAIRLFKPGALKFAYPFEFDAETRLKSKGRVKSVLDEFAERRGRLLQKGADSFDKAIQRDRSYAVAYVNLAAVDTLIGDRDNAVILTNRAMEMARKNNETITLANALVVRGIAYAEGGNKERAMVDMAAARNLGSSAAAANLLFLQGEPGQPAPKSAAEIDGGSRETVAGISARDNFLKDKEVTTFSLKGVDKDEPTITVHSRQGKGWEDMVISVDGKLIRLLAAGKGYGQESARGIRIGSSFEEMGAKYGEPARVFTSRQGTYYLYRKAETIFAVDPQGRVAGWMTYALQ